MSNDLISRDAILKRIEKIRQGVQMMDDIRRASITMTGMHLCEEVVRNQPSAQPERKKGRWILTEDENYEYCTCSECGYQNGENWMNGSDIPFCAMCGADMRGEQDG